MDSASSEARAQINALPDATMELSGFWIGDITTLLVDAGTDRERVVVTKADPHIMASPKLINDWLSDYPSPHVAVDRSGERPIVRFGTEGDGSGEVAYEIDDSGLKNGSLVTHVHLRRVA
jgi:hypothetical protein